MKNWSITIILFFVSALLHAQGSYAHQQVLQLHVAHDKLLKTDYSKWNYLSCDSCVHFGNSGEIIRLLKQNLVITEDLVIKNMDNLFDSSLYKALVKYQKRNGLFADGILGTETIECMNVPVISRSLQIEEGIKKWESFDKDIQEPYVLVNLPDFTLKIIDSGKVLHELKVIIGTKEKQTPILQSKVYAIVYNPSWYVPSTIAENEIVPSILKNSAYLEKNKMVVRNKTTMEVITDFNCKNLDQILFEQTPGNYNSLGTMKFLFRNTYAVFLHDTPEKYLFNHPKRMYSHGCIRVENPEVLVGFLLNKSVREIKDYRQKAADNDTLRLKKPFPISISYFTCFTNEEGVVQYRMDCYKKEENF